MARQLKTFLKNKKGMRNCNECKCILLGLWRCADEFCGCWEETNNAVPQPPVPSPAPIVVPDPEDNEPEPTLDDLNG